MTASELPFFFLPRVYHSWIFVSMNLIKDASKDLGLPLAITLWLYSSTEMMIGCRAHDKLSVVCNVTPGVWPMSKITVHV